MTTLVENTQLILQCISGCQICYFVKYYLFQYLQAEVKERNQGNSCNMTMCFVGIIFIFKILQLICKNFLFYICFVLC